MTHKNTLKRSGRSIAISIMRGWPCMNLGFGINSNRLRESARKFRLVWNLVRTDEPFMPNYLYYNTRVWQYYMPDSYDMTCEESFHCEAPFHELTVRVVQPPAFSHPFRLDLVYASKKKDIFAQSGKVRDDGWTESGTEMKDWYSNYKACHLSVQYRRFTLSLV